jgi:hypothetical protein
MNNIWKLARLGAYLTFFTGLALFFLAVENNSNASWGLLMISSSPLIYLVANTIRIIDVLAAAKIKKVNERI